MSRWRLLVLLVLASFVDSPCVGPDWIQFLVPTCGCETATVEVEQQDIHYPNAPWFWIYSGPTESAFYAHRTWPVRTRCIDPAGVLLPSEWVEGFGNSLVCGIPELPPVQGPQ